MHRREHEAVGFALAAEVVRRRQPPGELQLVLEQTQGLQVTHAQRARGLRAGADPQRDGEQGQEEDTTNNWTPLVVNQVLGEESKTETAKQDKTDDGNNDKAFTWA